MLRHRSGRVLKMGSVHVMISGFSVQRVEANFRVDLSRGACALYEDRSHYSQMPLECAPLLVG